MNKNVGPIDKVIRLIIAIALVGLYFMNVIPSPFDYVGLALAGIMVLTTVINFCPLYLPFGIKTCRKKR
ncbi:MAG: DUF2892 domain-containing protein [Bacteroidales bacterium]|nr:DUF2892 domain-containing protein [Bacteroidales bacterium]